MKLMRQVAKSLENERNDVSYECSMSKMTELKMTEVITTKDLCYKEHISLGIEWKSSMNMQRTSFGVNERPLSS